MNTTNQIYRHEFIVGAEALDENRHINNVAYVQWMQDIAIMHSDARGGRQTMRELGATWVARSHKIEYFAPAFSGDLVEAATWLSSFRRVRAVRCYKFTRKTDGTVLALGETEWIFVDLHSGRPRSIPESYIAAIQPLPPNEEQP